MPAWVWTVLKWTAAVVLMAAVVWVSLPMIMEQLQGAVEFGGDGDEADATPEATGGGVATPEVEQGTARSVAAVGARGGIVESPAAPEVTVAPGAADELLVAFEPLPADPACLTNVTLEIQLVESTETSVYVRPAQVAELAALGEGESLPADWLPADIEPARAHTNGTPGGLRWDVTVTYALAAREAEPGTNVVLSVYTPEGDPERATVLATGVGDEARAPFLDWSGIVGCDDPGPVDAGTEAPAEGAGTETPAEGAG